MKISNINKLISNLQNIGYEKAAKVIEKTFTSTATSNNKNKGNSVVHNLANRSPQQGMMRKETPLAPKGKLSTVPEAGDANRANISDSVNYLLHKRTTTPRDANVVLPHAEVLEAYRQGVPPKPLLDHLLKQYRETDFLSLQTGKQIPIGVPKYDDGRAWLSVMKTFNNSSTSIGAAKPSETDILKWRNNFVLSEKHTEEEKLNFNKILDDVANTEIGRAVLDLLVNQVGKIQLNHHSDAKHKHSVVRSIEFVKPSDKEGEIRIADLEFNFDLSSPNATGQIVLPGVYENKINADRVATFVHEAAHVLVSNDSALKFTKLGRAWANGALSKDDLAKFKVLLHQQDENLAVLVENLARAEQGLPLRYPVYDSPYPQFKNIQEQYAEIRDATTSSVAEDQGSRLHLAIDLASGKIRELNTNETFHGITPWAETLKKNPVNTANRTVSPEVIVEYYKDPDQIGHSDYGRHGDPIVVVKDWSDDDKNYLIEHGIPLESNGNPTATFRVWSDGFQQVDIALPTGGVLAMRPEYFDELLAQRADVKHIFLEYVGKGEPSIAPIRGYHEQREYLNYY